MHAAPRIPRIRRASASSRWTCPPNCRSCATSPAWRAGTGACTTASPPKALPGSRAKSAACCAPPVPPQSAPLSDRVTPVRRHPPPQGGPLPPADAPSRQIHERMINDLLQVQLAKETGIKVDDRTLDKTIERIAQENPLSLPDFRGALEKDGIK